MKRRGQVRIGTSGWVYRHWRGDFYPLRLRVGDWFAFYARRFDTVEINNTFYRLPSESAVAAWKEQAPPDFLYGVKASRFLTHRKKLKDPKGPLDMVLGLARRLGDRLGPMVYQLPPRWRCDVPRLRQFLGLLPRDLTHVIEFRDPSWCNDEVRGLLAETGTGYCIHDMPGFSCPAWVTARTVYVRFHGPGGQRYAGRYNRGFLRDWARRIDNYRESGHDVFVFFNNDGGGHAVANALELKEELGERVRPTEPYPARKKLFPA
jgi:uncharacterized protein YecE (DUF72 family)